MKITAQTMVGVFVIVALAIISCSPSPAASNANTDNTNNSSVSADGIVPTKIVNGVVVAATKKGPDSIDYYRNECLGSILEGIFIVDKSISDDNVYYFYVDGRLNSVEFKANGIKYEIDCKSAQLAKYEPKSKALREQVIKEFSKVMPTR